MYCSKEREENSKWERSYYWNAEIGNIKTLRRLGTYDSLEKENGAACLVERLQNLSFTESTWSREAV